MTFLSPDLEIKVKEGLVLRALQLQPATRVWFLILYYVFVHLCEQQTNSKLQLLQTGSVGYGRSGKQADST